MSNKTQRDEKTFNQAALDYHKAEPKGKIEVIPSKPHSSQRFVFGIFSGRCCALYGNSPQS